MHQYWVRGIETATALLRMAIFAEICVGIPVALAATEGVAKPTQIVPNRLSSEVAEPKPVGRVLAATRIHLSIGLALPRNAELETFIKDAYDPKSSQYRRFLTPQSFTSQFAPSAPDYAKVIKWAKSHGLKVERTYSNRILVDVTGTAGNVERALHVKLVEALRPDRTKFFRPDRDPAIDLSVPINGISGLNNFLRPPHLGGSAINGAYASRDLRAAYVPGSQLTGRGQSIGIVAFDGYNPSDVAAYRSDVGLAAVTLAAPVLFGGASATPSGSSAETVADIELAMAMAPEAHLQVYITASCVNFDSMLNSIATSSPMSLQNASSYGICWGPNTLTLFGVMASQGQSYFMSSGDNGACLAHSQQFDQAKVTVVGGTTLTMNGAGISYVSEVTWDDPVNRMSSGGCVEYNIPIPTWQQNTAFSPGSGASTINRNNPDVAMVAQDLYIRSSQPLANKFEGTSAATPLWAGFMALVNERWALAGMSGGIGSASDAVWNIGRNNAAYPLAFNDITSGTAPVYPGGTAGFSAGPGYDLTTGWGSPKPALIDQMACVQLGAAGHVPSVPPNCEVSIGTSLGDPHITTHDGLLYDFQAAGDFLLATTGPSFVVQARQNWAPNHPNVAVNKAMAVGMGKARIALFLDPLRLVVDERQAPLADGQSLLLPDGVEVTRSGTIYLITSAHGETVRAEVIDNSWIGGTFMNIAVALNYVSSGGMRGLLGNGNGNLLDDLSTRDADSLRQPVTFGELYRDFAESMRVQAAQSLFVKINVAGNDGPSVIAEATFELPTRPYTVSDLTPQEYRVARAACKKVGLTAAAMLDACTLDTAVLGSPDVAKMYSRVLVVPQGVLNPGVGIVDPDTGCALQCAETQCNKRSHHHAAHRTPDSRDNK